MPGNKPSTVAGCKAGLKVYSWPVLTKRLNSAEAANLKKSVFQFRDILIGLFLLSGILALIQSEMAIPTLLFALLTYGAVNMIESATERDLKRKQIDKS